MRRAARFIGGIFGRGCSFLAPIICWSSTSQIGMIDTP
jgi:hypothetical protein